MSGFVLVVFGLNKERMKVNISPTYMNRDDNKKPNRLSPTDLETKFRVHAKYLLGDNYYAYNWYQIE